MHQAMRFSTARSRARDSALRGRPKETPLPIDSGTKHLVLPQGDSHIARQGGECKGKMNPTFW